MYHGNAASQQLQFHHSLGGGSITVLWRDTVTSVAPLQTRYTAVRRQTAPAPGVKETQVLDYQNVSAELLPTVAAAYALKFMGQVCIICHKSSVAQ